MKKVCLSISINVLQAGCHFVGCVFVPISHVVVSRMMS